MAQCGDGGVEELVQKAFDAHPVAAAIHLSSFPEMLRTNPDKAIGTIGTIYDNALDEAYTNEEGENHRYLVEAMAGGPCEVIPWILYNNIGTVYPSLERSQKDIVLKQIFGILDKRNYAEVNGVYSAGHTPGIREPLLLSDICIARPLYWPGLYDEEQLWKKFDNFYDFEKNVMGEGTFRKDMVNSDFLVAYAVLRTDFTNFGGDFAEYLRENNPNFLGRVIKGIVGLRFTRAETSEKVESKRKRLEEILPRSLHDGIEPLRQEADWVDFKLFP